MHIGTKLNIKEVSSHLELGYVPILCLLQQQEELLVVKEDTRPCSMAGSYHASS